MGPPSAPQPGRAGHAGPPRRPWYQNTYRTCSGFPYSGFTYQDWTDEEITVRHAHTIHPFGCSTDDEFHENVRLINNWAVDDMHFSAVVSESGEAEAKVAQWRKGSDNPYVKVHHWVTAWDWVAYTLSVYIKGPKGTDFIEDDT
jgi:hypothetical protein